MMRKFDDLTGLVHVGDTWWGELFWLAGGAAGCDVRRFANTRLQEAFVSLHEEAKTWLHEDPYAWLVLDIDEPVEVGDDFVMMRRRPGVALRSFFPSETDDPVDPPSARLALLGVTDNQLRKNATTAPARFVAELVHRRIDAHDRHVVFDLRSERFFISDFDPSAAELETWISVR